MGFDSADGDGILCRQRKWLTVLTLRESWI
jgi:hypothetical protein